MNDSALAVGLVVQGTRRGKASSQRERILWLDRASNIAVTIALDDKKAVPEVSTSKDLDRRWASGELVQIGDDYSYLAVMDTSRHKDRLDRNWAAIRSIVEDEPNCYDARRRAKLVTAAEKRSKRKRDTLIRDLRRYWQAGKQEAALATQYDRSGGAGQPRDFEGRRKPGPRGIMELHGHIERGLPVNAEIAGLFETYLKKYVLRIKPLTMAAAYSQLCKDHFSAKKMTTAGRQIVELLPLDRRPTLRQFRYYAQQNHKISERKKAQDGIEAYEQTLRPVLGNTSTHAFACYLARLLTDPAWTNSFSSVFHRRISASKATNVDLRSRIPLECSPPDLPNMEWTARVHTFSSGSSFVVDLIRTSSSARPPYRHVRVVHARQKTPTPRDRRDTTVDVDDTNTGKLSGSSRIRDPKDLTRPLLIRQNAIAHEDLSPPNVIDVFPSPLPPNVGTMIGGRGGGSGSPAVWQTSLDEERKSGSTKGAEFHPTPGRDTLPLQFDQFMKAISEAVADLSGWKVRFAYRTRNTHRSHIANRWPRPSDSYFSRPTSQGLDVPAGVLGAHHWPPALLQQGNYCCRRLC